jgi:hypothetical protein
VAVNSLQETGEVRFPQAGLALQRLKPPASHGYMSELKLRPPGEPEISVRKKYRSARVHLWRTWIPRATGAFWVVC